MSMLFIISIATIDIICYAVAKYPQRKQFFWIPFVGGIIALCKYGR